MAILIFLFVICFGGVLGVYFFLTRKMHASDVERVKGRILGREKPGRKKTGNAAAPAALIQTPELRKGKLVMQMLDRANLSDKIEIAIEKAGQRTTLTQFINTSLLLALGAGVASFLFLPSRFQLAAIPITLLGGMLPYMNLIRLANARQRRFEEIFPDALEFIARSMRAGHAFSVSLEMIHREFADPVGTEFKRTFEEHNLGLPLDHALEKLAKRVPTMDMHFFVSAVLLQKRTGGNLAEILDKLAYVIRERFKLRGKIRAISAHGKMTASALSCIPIGTAVLMFFTNPTYVKFFFEDEVGNYMLAGAVVLQLIGYAIMQKIVDIEV